MHKHLTAIMIILLVLQSCSGIFGDRPSGDDRIGTDSPEVDVTFRIGEISCATRSSFTVDEETVNDLSLLVYRNGALFTSAYMDDHVSSIVLRLSRGESYDIYALANMGDISFTSEDDLLGYRYDISSLESLNDGYPMCWSMTGYTVDTGNPAISISLTRLVAKVAFSLDPGVLDGLEVTSVRLMQSSRVISPFGMDRKALSSSEVMDGDYASLADLAEINAGGSITMYVPENCQGTLLGGNTDPWSKTPENISAGDRCTYIEVACTFSEGFALSGDVIYRMYLGSDNCSNFDVVRNSIYALSLTLTGEGLDEISWKISPDLAYNEGLVTAWLDRSMHDADDLYIGEIVRVGLRLEPSMQKLLESKLEDGLVTVEGENGAMRAVSGFVKDGDEYYIDMVCSSESDENLFLCESGDEPKDIDFLMQCDIHRPRMMIAAAPSAQVLTQAMESSIKTPVINGDPILVNIYLTDGDGRNLMGTGQYGFDTSFFSSLSCTLSPYSQAYTSALAYCTDTRTYSSTTVRTFSGQPLATYEHVLAIPDSQRSTALPARWAEMYAYQDQHGSALTYRYSCTNVSNSVSRNRAFGIIRPSISWDFFSESMDITNPSNIEIISDLYEINPDNTAIQYKSSYTAVNTSGYPSLSASAPGSPQKPLYIHKMTFNTREQSQYASRSSDGTWTYTYRFALDYPQISSNSGDTPIRVLASMIGGIGFDYSYECLSDDGTTYDEVYPAVIRYIDYDTPAATHNDMCIRTPMMRRHYGLLNSGQSTIGNYTYFSLESSTPTTGWIMRDIVEMHRDRASRARARISITYSNYDVRATITSNPYGIGYYVGVEEGTASGTCRWRSFSTQSYKTDTHTITIPMSGSNAIHTGYAYKSAAINATSVTGTVGTVVFPSTEITKIFQNLNVGCWHNASEKAVATASNRRSNFTLPSSMDIGISACGSQRLVPVDVVISTPSTTATVLGNIYASTVEGTYSLDGMTANLDRTDRDTKNINNEEIPTTSNTVASSSKTFTLNMSAGVSQTNQVTYYVR